MCEGRVGVGHDLVEADAPVPADGFFAARCEAIEHDRHVPVVAKPLGPLEHVLLETAAGVEQDDGRKRPRSVRLLEGVIDGALARLLGKRQGPNAAAECQEQDTPCDESPKRPRYGPGISLHALLSTSPFTYQIAPGLTQAVRLLKRRDSARSERLS